MLDSSMVELATMEWTIAIALFCVPIYSFSLILFAHSLAFHSAL